MSELRRTECAGLEAAPLEILTRVLDPYQAEEVLCNALEELAVRLGHLERICAARDEAGIRMAASGVSKVAGRLGMIRLVQVAGDLQQSLSNDDQVARAAIEARLMRLGEASLMAFWERQEYGC
ncbi:hypothetical protein [Poseidonocella sedimentorum]|uniref:hypothetical protein n=1 Tax=Poseidonocella sedimentorum TaxID=871652 RepID=UPI0011601F15|nr:hypothetical protein [Poseidonocella sedimentorum]